MINQSFICLDKIGSTTEQKLWSHNVHTWDDFIQSSSVPGISAARKTMYNLSLQKAQRNLHIKNMHYLQTLFPSNEQWRLYDEFKEEALYIDIETTGYYGDMTVLGMYNGSDTMIMVKGKNMDKTLFEETLARHKIILTFNGSSFDLPIIQKYFKTKITLPHIDLRHVCAKIGLHGGLKAIEKQLGINRDAAVEGVTGFDAVTLWHQYKMTGDETYLKKLIMYNEEDIINLKPLAEYAIPRLWKSRRFGNSV